MDQSAGELPSMAEFSEQLNSTFKVHSADAVDFEAELVEMNVLVSNDVQENFSLLFKTARSVPALQGIYNFDSGAALFDVFLVPVSHDNESLYFEAVFNNFTVKDS